MKKRNITNAGEIAHKHTKRNVEGFLGEFPVSGTESPLEKLRHATAVWIYSRYFSRKSMNARKGLEFFISSFSFDENVYRDYAEPFVVKKVGEVVCNDKVPELLETDTDKNIVRPLLENTSMNTLAEKLTEFGSVLTGYGAGLEVIQLLDRTDHFYTWEEGDYLFPGVLMTNGNGEWCVPEIRIRLNEHAPFGRSIEVHIIPLTARPKTKKHVVWIEKNAK